MNCFCTVITRSHLLPALVLARSLEQAGNAEILHLLIVDWNREEKLTLPANVRAHALDEIEGQYPPLMRHYFDAFEISNTLKPFLVRLLLEADHDCVAYLDSDLYVVGSFQPVWSQLRSRPVLLTPHQLAPPALELAHTNEVEIVDQGIYNGGFAAYRRGDAALRVLAWMCERFPRYGFNRRAKGMFVDQKLLPFLPVYFPDDVQIWRSPTVNIAFWNVHERSVHQRHGTHHDVAGEPVVFFHLSGFRVDRPELPCVYLPASSNEAILASAPWFGNVLAAYAQLWRDTPAPPPAPDYPFNHYNGLQLTPDLRTLLFQSGDLDPRNHRVRWLRFIDFLKRLKRRLRS